MPLRRRACSSAVLSQPAAHKCAACPGHSPIPRARNKAAPVTRVSSRTRTPKPHSSPRFFFRQLLPWMQLSSVNAYLQCTFAAELIRYLHTQQDCVHGHCRHLAQQLSESRSTLQDCMHRWACSACAQQFIVYMQPLCVPQVTENLVRSKATMRQLSVSRMCTCVHCQTYRPWQRWCMRLCQ